MFPIYYLCNSVYVFEFRHVSPKTIKIKVAHQCSNSELREGNILRVGRLAMIFQTADETQTHAWNNSERKWEELSNNYRNPTRKGLRIANKLATVDLMELPLQPAKEVN